MRSRVSLCRNIARCIDTESASSSVLQSALQTCTTVCQNALHTASITPKLHSKSQRQVVLRRITLGRENHDRHRHLLRRPALSFRAARKRAQGLDSCQTIVKTQQCTDRCNRSPAQQWAVQRCPKCCLPRRWLSAQGRAKSQKPDSWRVCKPSSATI